MAGTAARTSVASAGPPALVVGGGVLEVGLAGVAGAGWERAFSVADLDEVAEGVVGLVRAGLVAVVAIEGRHRPQLDHEVPAAGQRERPVAVPARRSRIGVPGEAPGGPAGRPGRGGQLGQAGGG